MIIKVYSNPMTFPVFAYEGDADIYARESKDGNVRDAIDFLKFGSLAEFVTKQEGSKLLITREEIK